MFNAILRESREADRHPFFQVPTSIETSPGAENALRARPKEDEALREEELNRFKRKVGELTVDLDILRTADRLRPMTPGTSDE